MKKRAADIIIDILLEHGITDCFGVVGGGAMHLDNALAVNDKIHKYFNHHEQASSMAATAYSRICGKMAAVFVTSGPGATNAITGVMGAWQDSLPMIVFSGQVRYAISVPQSGLKLRYRGIQEFEIIPSVKNMTKYAVMLTDPLAVRREVVKAIHIAMDGRRGPVWIDVPQDIQNARVEESELYPEEPFVSEVPDPEMEDVDYILDKLKAAKRPLILAGSGIISSGCRDDLEALVDMFGIPVVGGAYIADNLYTDHPLYFGISGGVGPRTGNFILQNADVILTLGNSLSFRQTGFNQEGFAPKAHIIMTDADTEEVKKPGLKVDRFVHTDAGKLIRALMDRHKGSLDVPKEWIDYCKGLKERFTPFEAVQGLDPEERVCSYEFWRVLRQFEKDDSIIALGNNTASTAKLQIGAAKKAQRVIENMTCGSMGDDIPAAIGAAVASGREVYCITGDGSFMMNMQELQTIVQYDLPVKIAVFSNDGYNAIRQTSKNFFNGVYIGCTADTGVSFPDFGMVAKTFGFRHILCRSNRELPEKLEEFVNAKDRVFLEVLQRLDDPVTPKVMSRLDENGNMLTPALQDMYPFLEKEEYDSLMLQ